MAKMVNVEFIFELLFRSYYAAAFINPCQWEHVTTRSLSPGPVDSDRNLDSCNGKAAAELNGPVTSLMT